MRPATNGEDSLRGHLASIGLLVVVATVGFVVGGTTGGVTAACAAVAGTLLIIRDRRFPTFLPSDGRRDVRAIVLLLVLLAALTAVSLTVGAIRGR
jgi:hypothetical protein